MKKLILASSLACLLAPVPTWAQNAYITNEDANTVSVIDTRTNTVIGSPISVGIQPSGVAITPDGSKVYVTNPGDNTVSVIDTATNTVIGSAINVGSCPVGVAASPDGSKVYVANNEDSTVSVIDTVTNSVIGSAIYVRFAPYGVAVTPDGSKVYLTNPDASNVSVIDTATNTVIITFPVNNLIPTGVAVSPDGSKVYVAGPDAVLAIDLRGRVTATVHIDNSGGVAITPDGSKVYVTGDNTVSVIDTATNTVIGSPISVGKAPFAFGEFIQPLVSTFSDFRAKLTMSSFQPSFALLADFTLGRTSNGINPLSEAVTIGIGTFTTTVPPGSFKMTEPGTYSFVGVINGLTLKSLIKLAGRKTYTFEAVANVGLTRQKAPTKVTLTIGNDTGTITVRL